MAYHLKYPGFAGLILGLILILSSACSGPSNSSGGSSKEELVLHAAEFPKSFNYFINNASDASEVFNLVYESLMELDYETLEYQPLIAESWTIAPDKKEFIIKLNPTARWGDGTPITAADVRFTYDTIMNPDNLTSVLRLYYSRLNPPEILDDRTVKFTTKSVHYKNFEMIAEFNVLPKHLMEGRDFNKAFNMSLPEGSGPYNLSEVKEGRYYVLTRKQNYWADELPQRQNTYNFAKIRYKVMNPDVAFEAFKRGDFDIFDAITAKRWMEDTKSDHFTKNWIVKQKFFNYAPRGFQGIALNMRRVPFNDSRVRRALAHLLNREQILAKIMYGEYRPLNSYFPALYEKGETANPPLTFDPERAKELLAEAGYDRLDSEGFLINAQRRRLAFSIAYVGQDNERYLTVFAEDCRQAGIKVDLKRMSWATLLKEMDSYNFDAVLSAWSGVLFPDPEQLWHSSYVNETGGSNLSGYQNPEVDRLIQTLPEIFDAAERTRMLKQLDRLIYREVPYILFWEADYSRLIYKNIFAQPAGSFSKYGVQILRHWRFDPEKVKRYREAVREKTALPAEPEEIHYEEITN